MGISRFEHMSKVPCMPEIHVFLHDYKTDVHEEHVFYDLKKYRQFVQRRCKIGRLLSKSYCIGSTTVVLNESWGVD